MHVLKEKWLECSRYRQILLILLILAFVVSLPAFLVISRREGLKYENTLLYPSAQGQDQIYQGKLDGETARFTISPQGTVTYEWSGQQYGPWQITEDPSAVPAGYNGAVGIEVRQGEAVLFRGCYLPGFSGLIWEDGEPLILTNGYSVSAGGHIISLGGSDPREPDLFTLTEIALEPELAHRGELTLLLLAIFVSVLNGFQICFPRLLFRLSLLGRVRDPDSAEPSEFYIAMEHIEWAVLTIFALILYGASLHSIVYV